MENRASVPAPQDICSAYPRGVSEMFDPFILYERAIEARLAEIERGTTNNQMRKFIVEIHPDGTVHATEYEEADERLDDIRDALRRIDMECVEEAYRAWDAEETYAFELASRIELLVDRVLYTYWG